MAHNGTRLASLPLSAESDWSQQDSFKTYVQMALDLKAATNWSDKEVEVFMGNAYRLALAETRHRATIERARGVIAGASVENQQGNGAKREVARGKKNKLIPVTELVEKNDIYLSIKRVEELADQGYLPCWYVDGVRLYSPTVAKGWIADNLTIEDDGARFPENLVVGVTRQRRPDYSDIPTSLKKLHEHLHQLPLWSPSGVYFLVENDVVVYVGATTSVVQRVPNHMNSKRFSLAFFIPLPEDQILEVERAFIRTLKPRYNGDANGRGYVGPEAMPEDDELTKSFMAEE